jgi:hypothetical protein
MFETIGFHHQGHYRLCFQLYAKNSAHPDKNYFGFPVIFGEGARRGEVLGGEEYSIDVQQKEYLTKK